MGFFGVFFFFFGCWLFWFSWLNKLGVCSSIFVQALCATSLTYSKYELHIYIFIFNHMLQLIFWFPCSKSTESKTHVTTNVWVSIQ